MKTNFEMVAGESFFTFVSFGARYYFKWSISNHLFLKTTLSRA